MIGKLLSLPIKILNIPARATEKIVAKMGGDDDIQEDRRVLSAPLQALSDAIEEIDK